METIKEILARVNRHIKYHRTDTPLNHIKTIVRLDSEKYSGYTTNSDFTIWRYAQTGVFHTVINGRVLMDGNNPKVIIKTRMNIVGLLFLILIIGGFTYGIYYLVIPSFDSPLSLIIQRAFIALLILSLPLIVILIGYRNKRREELETIKAILENV